MPLLLTLAQAADVSNSGMDSSDLVSLIAGLTSLVAIAITSLRKRQDVSLEEMKQRIADLEKENGELTGDRDLARASAVTAQRDLFLVRQVLAKQGLPDPTQRAGE